MSRARSTSLSKTPGWYLMPLERTGSSPTWRSRRTRSSAKVLSPEWDARTIRVWRRSIATGSQVSSGTAHEVTDKTVAGEASMSDASVFLHAPITTVQVAYHRAAIALQAAD